MVPVLSLVFSVFSGVGHMVSRRQVRQELGTFPSVLTLESEGGWPGYPTPGHLEPEEQSLHSLFCSLLLIIFSFYLQSINILGTNSSSEDEKSRRTHPVERTEGFCPFRRSRSRSRSGSRSQPRAYQNQAPGFNWAPEHFELGPRSPTQLPVIG